MRVAVHPEAADACAFYRMSEPARVLAGQGADVDHRVGHRYRVAGHGPALSIVEPACDLPDVVVVQRPLSDWQYRYVRAFQAKGVAVVVELDDDFGAVHPENSAHFDASPRWLGQEEWERAGRPSGRTASRSGRAWHECPPGVTSARSNVWLRRACKHADLVTVTTPALADRYAPHGRVVVLPNLVPERYLAVSAPPHDGVVVGWGGTVATHPEDLAVTGGGVGRAVSVSGARFRVVGDGVRVRADLGLEVEPEVAGWVSFEGWPAALASFDVGIVPLAPSRFNEAKSALKMAELAAVGVPVVASPTPDNVRLARRGVGLLASDPARWEQWVRLLAENGEARVQLAGRGREVMAGQTYEAHAGRWWDAWTQARANADARLNERTAA